MNAFLNIKGYKGETKVDPKYHRCLWKIPSDSVALGQARKKDKLTILDYM